VCSNSSASLIHVRARLAKCSLACGDAEVWASRTQLSARFGIAGHFGLHARRLSRRRSMIRFQDEKGESRRRSRLGGRPLHTRGRPSTHGTHKKQTSPGASPLRRGFSFQRRLRSAPLSPCRIARCSARLVSCNNSVMGLCYCLPERDVAAYQFRRPPWAP
jgi:hypothetical protein